MSVISSSAVLDALVAAGVIRVEDRATRVVIDCRVGDAAVIHVQRVGDERLLSVIPNLDGVEVRRDQVPEPACSCPDLDASGPSDLDRGQRVYIKGWHKDCPIHGHDGTDPTYGRVWRGELRVWDNRPPTTGIEVGP